MIRLSDNAIQKSFVLQSISRSFECQRWFYLSFLMLSPGFLFANDDVLNCAIAHTDNRIQQCPEVRYASEFGACLSSADIDSHVCVIMDEDLSLCDAEQSVAITAMFDRSNKTLDCQGGTIDLGWSSETVSSHIANARNLPMVRFYDDRSLSNITVQNCHMRGTLHAAVQMIRFFGGELGGNGKLDEGEPLPLGHNNITLENLTIVGGQTGVYLGNFSQDIVMNNLNISDTKRIAVYSEAGSNRISLTNSTITNNKTREAIAIDSTYDSLISNNVIANNREGGIHVYQNCGELKGTVCPVVRSTPPNNNQILDNTFINNGISSLQIASRQGRRHALGWCATLNGLPGQFQDTAQDNLVQGNTINCDDGVALVLMDGPNTVRNNDIVASNGCIPYEVSTGGFTNVKSDVLQGLKIQNNNIVSSRPPRLRNVNGGVTINNVPSD